MTAQAAQPDNAANLLEDLLSGRLPDASRVSAVTRDRRLSGLRAVEQLRIEFGEREVAEELLLARR